MRSLFDGVHVVVDYLSPQTRLAAHKTLQPSDRGLTEK